MNQQLHNWYLSVLGITQYIPRESASVLAASQSPAIKVEADTSVEPGDQQVYSKRKPGPRITIDLNTSETEKPAAPVTVTDSSAITQATPAARFRLACWQPSDDLLVIDSLEPGEQPGAERTQLLVNILRSIKRMPDTIAQAELIDWPVSANSQSTEAGARALLSVFLDARIKQRGVCWVLLMGEMAAMYIGETGIGEAGANFTVGSHRELSGGAKAVLTHSLQNMLDAPACKADTWQAIRFLLDV
ncbi:MAG: hypothetical protein R3E73_07205 [Porticoccaceae bacterium]|nr:hypothetical protein [Pseudomonadales bacterium]MCP5172488.1 hypothetical protein [Pseudomonadales bacterium]